MARRDGSLRACCFLAGPLLGCVLSNGPALILQVVGRLRYNVRRLALLTGHVFYTFFEVCALGRTPPSPSQFLHFSLTNNIDVRSYWSRRYGRPWATHSLPEALLWLVPMGYETVIACAVTILKEPCSPAENTVSCSRHYTSTRRHSSRSWSKTIMMSWPTIR